MELKKTFGFTDDWKKILPAIIAAVGIISYANSFSSPFIFDDSVAITGSKTIKQLWPPVIGLRMVVNTSFSLNYAIGGLNVADYHVTNLFIHIWAGLLLYGIVRRTLLLPRFRAISEDKARWLAIACASIWVAHPLQTESVTYICQRYESMMGLFCFITLYSFIRAQSSGRKRLWYGLSLVSCVAGVGSKEIAATAPLVVLLYDHVFVADSVSQIARTRWKYYVAMFMTWGILAGLMVTTMAHHVEKGIPFATTGVSSLDYFFTETGVIKHYLWLSIFPRDLCLDYFWPPSVGLKQIAGPTFFLLFLGISTCWAIWRRRPAGFLGGWFFIILAPTSSFMPVGDAAFEHRMYLPLAAVVALVVIGVFRISELLISSVRHMAWVRGLRAVQLVIPLAILATLAILTLKRNEVYQSHERMWRDVLSKSPANIRAMTAIIDCLLTNEQYAEAEDFTRILLATLEGKRNPTTSGYMFSQMPFYYSEARSRLGFVLVSQGKAEDSIAHLREAVRNKPQDAVARHNLSLALFMTGKREEAFREIDTAIRLAPKSDKPRVLKAFFCAKKGEYAEAINAYRHAVELNRNNMLAETELAWLLAVCPDDSLRDGPLAREMAESICRRTEFQSSRALGVLAAACAECGCFDEARKYQKQALEMKLEELSSAPKAVSSMTRGGQDEKTSYLPEISKMRSRLELYEKGKAFRERE